MATPANLKVIASVRAKANPQPHQANAPRCLIQIGDDDPVAPVDYTVEFNSHGATDTARVLLPLSSCPDYSVKYEAVISPIPIKIYAGFPLNPTNGSYNIEDLQLRFSGVIDQFQANFVADELVVTCRSLAAYLVAAKHTTQYKETTTVQLVQDIASAQGIKTNIHLRDNQRPLLLKEVFAQEFMVGVRNMRQWDMLVACAQSDVVDLWVDPNGTLNYVAPDLVSGPQMDLVIGANVKDFTVTHSPFFSTNIEVQVYSWQTKHRTFIGSHTSQTINADGTPGDITTTTSMKTTTTSPNWGTDSTTTSSTGYSVNSNGNITSSTNTGYSFGSGGSASSGFTRFSKESNKEVYRIYRPGLSKDACDSLSMNIWKQISLHEYLADFTFIVEPQTLQYCNISATFNVTGARWDNVNSNPQSAINSQKKKIYRPRRMTETFSPISGWMIEVTAVNHPLPAGEANGGDF